MINLPDSMKAVNSNYGAPKEPFKIEKPTTPTSPIPSGYQFMPDRSSLGSTYEVAPSATSVFRNLPTGGQYTMDKPRNNPLIKSVRKDENTAAIRNGIPAFAAQVDHIIPLWAGGTDNSENKQILSIPQHEKKTKVDAVVSTLYYNKVIPIGGARAMMMNWKNLDTSIVNLVPDKENSSVGGKLAEDPQESLAKAMAIKQQWDNPKTVPVSLNDVWQEAKKNPIVHGINSAISAFTGGWINPNKDITVEKNQETTTAVADAIGSIAGTVASFVALDGLLVGAARIAGMGNLAKAWSAGSSLNKAKTAITGEKISVSLPRGMQTLHDTGILVAQGQLSREAYDGNRSQRFMSDVAFGGILGVPGNTLKSYAGLAMGVYTLGKVEGASDKEALLNAAVMTGLHKMAEPARIKAVDDAATRAAAKWRTTYDEKVFPEATNADGTLIPQSKLAETFQPGTVTFSAKELNASNQRIFNKIDAIAANNPGVITAEIVNEEKKKALITAKQLFYGNLGEEKGALERSRDLKSLFSRENALASEDGVLPENLAANIKNKLENIFEYGKGNLSKEQRQFIAEKGNSLPTGKINLSGTPYEKNGESISEAIRQGVKNGDNVIIKYRPDQENFIQRLAAGKSSLAEGFGNPKYTAEVYAIYGNKIRRIGFIPSFERMAIRENNQLSAAVDKSLVDISLNKDNICRAIEANGGDFAVAKIEYILPAREGKSASCRIEITPESYTVDAIGSHSAPLGKLTSQGKSIHTVLFGKDSFYDKLDNARKKKINNVLLDREAASDLVPEAVRSGYNTYFSGPMEELGKAVHSRSIPEVQKVFREGLGVKIGEDAAKKIMEKPRLKVGDIIASLRDMSERTHNEKLMREVRAEKPLAAAPARQEAAPAPETARAEIMEKETHSEKGVKDLETGEVREISPDKKELDLEEKSNVIEEAAETAERKSGPRDVMTYEYGSPKILPFDAAVKKARDSGNETLADSLMAKKQEFSPEGRKTYAQELLRREQGNKKNPSQNDFNTAFERFKESYVNAFHELGMENLLEGNKYSQMLRHHFMVLAQSEPYHVIRMVGDTLEKGEFHDKPGSYLLERIKDFKRSNPDVKNDLNVYYLDDGGSVWESDIRSPRQRKNAFYRQVEESGNLIPIATTDKQIKNLMVMDKSPELVERFDRNPERYLDDAAFEDKKAFEALTDTDKQLKVFSRDILGYERDASADTLIKRLKITDSRENYVPIDRDLKMHVLKSPKLADISDPAQFKTWKDIVTGKDVADSFDKAIWDGKIFMMPEDVNEITKTLGFSGRRNQIKPTFSFLDDKDNLILQKGDISVIDKKLKKFFEDKLGKELQAGDIVTFGDNIKVASKDIKQDIENGITVIKAPFSSMRVKFANPHKARASFSPSILANFAFNDGINKDVAALFRPQVEKYARFIKDLNACKSGEDIKAVFSKPEYAEYKVDLDRDLYQKLQQKINNGAGKYLVNDQLHKMTSKIFEKQILKGGFLRGNHLTLSIDFGVKNGEFLKPGEIMMSREAWEKMGKPEFVVTARYPVTHKLALSKDKVVVAEDYDISHLGENQVILSNSDVIITKQGDTDGDSVHLFAVGGENALPESMANAIETSRAEGDLILQKLEKLDKRALTAKNMSEITDMILLGNDGINRTSATKRVMESAVDAKLQIKVVNDGGKKRIIPVLGEKQSPLSEGFLSKEPFEKEELYPVRFGNQEKAITAQILQESIDAATSKNLSERMGKDFDLNVLLQEYAGTDDKDVLRGLSAGLKYLQGPFTLKEALGSNRDLMEAVAVSNKRSAFVLENGGEIGPMQELLRLFEQSPETLVYTSGKDELSRLAQTHYDALGRQAVIDKYKDRFAVGNQFEGRKDFILPVEANSNINRGKVGGFISYLKDFKTKYDEAEAGNGVTGYNRAKDLSARERSTNKNLVRAYRSRLRNEFYTKWEEGKGKFNQDELDAISYYLTTAHDANISFNRKYYKPAGNNSYFSGRFESIFNDVSPEVARTYNLGAEAMEWEPLVNRKVTQANNEAMETTLNKANKGAEEFLLANAPLADTVKASQKNKLNKLRKQLKIASREGRNGDYKEVEGYVFNVGDHIKTFLHKNRAGSWTMSEYKTGMALGSGDTPQQAKTQVEAALKKWKITRQEEMDKKIKENKVPLLNA